jgi:dUTP pyrophosphatase
MKIRIKRIDKEIPLPRYETDGSVGFDILARLDTVITAGKIALIPGNVIVEVPAGYVLTVASRSSTPIKKGLLTPHGIGIIDHDYCGNEDEIKIQVYNFSDDSVTVKRGDKIAQGLFIRADKFEWEEVADMDRKSRGGFGSTDDQRIQKNLKENIESTDERHIHYNLRHK